MNHSEPECEVHPVEKACDRLSNTQSSHLCLNMQYRVCNDTAMQEDQTLAKPIKKQTMEVQIPCTKNSKNASLGNINNKDDSRPFNNSPSLQKPVKDFASIALDNFQDVVGSKNEEDSHSALTFDNKKGTEGDDLSFCLDLEGADDEIQNAINEIRNEAEKLNTVLILDQFKTLQTDFDSLSKKCDLKVAENEDLKKLLQESENKSSIMELERDLLKANEQKLREDLETVVSKMFDISLYESSELNKEKNIVDNIKSIDSKQCEKLSERVECQNFVSHNEKLPIEVRKKIPFRNGHKVIPTLMRENMRITGLIDQPRHVMHQLSLLGDSSLTHVKSKSLLCHHSNTNTFGLHLSSCEDRPLRNQSIFRERTYHGAHHEIKGSTRAEQKSLTGISSDGKENNFKSSFYRHHNYLSAIDTKPTSFIIESVDEEAAMQNKRCGMFCRRRNKGPSFSREDVSLLKRQISQLQEMTKTSLAASDKLRKKLQVISQHYEGIIRKLQTKVGEVEREKSKMKVDLANTVAIRRQLEKSKSRYELCCKDGEINRFKAEDRGEV